MVGDTVWAEEGKRGVVLCPGASPGGENSGNLLEKRKLGIY